MAPEQDCLQYHTAQVYLVQNQKWLSLNQSVTALPFPQLGTIATFNWDFSTSATAVASSQTHLSRWHNGNRFFILIRIYVQPRVFSLHTHACIIYKPTYACIKYLLTGGCVIPSSSVRSFSSPS